MNSREAFRNYLKTGARIGESMEKTFKAGFLSGLASQQDHIGDSNKLVNKVVFDSESARQFLIESVLPKFSDSTFQKYVLEELAGDFAYQLAMYLQSQTQMPNYGLHELAQIIMSDCGISTTNNDQLYDRILGRLIASSELQSQEQQESQWFLIETAPKNKKIIVTYKNALGKNRTVFAKYIEKFTEESTLDTECETDYCEEDDTFYLKEGWVELIDNWDEFSSVYFDSRNVPTHWMDIPPAPEGDDK